MVVVLEAEVAVARNLEETETFVRMEKDLVAKDALKALAVVLAGEEAFTGSTCNFKA